MGLLDTGTTSVPAFGVDTGPRETYRPPKVLRRLDIPAPKETLRDLLLKAVREKPCDWHMLSQSCPGHKDAEIAVVMTQLVREHLLAVDRHGAFVFVESHLPKASHPQAAVVHPKEACATSGTIELSQKASPGDTSQKSVEALKSVVALLSVRALEAEERYQRLLRECRAELVSEQQTQKVLQAQLLELLI